DAVRKYFEELNNPNVSDEVKTKRKEELEKLAKKGLPPPVPPSDAPDGTYLGPHGDRFRYSWVEMGKEERRSLGLSNDAASQPGTTQWSLAAEARAKNQPLLLPAHGQILLYSRNFESLTPRDDERDKKYEYFLLLRDPPPGKEINGQYLTDA